MPEEPHPAPHVRDLPLDGRGYRIPAEVPWIDGVPMIANIDPVRSVALAAYRACAVCGYGIPQGELMWRIRDQHSRLVTHQEIAQGSLVPENDPPGHLVCMLYSALVCPYWRTQGGRLGRESQYQPGAKRGTEPSIMGFTDYALMLSERPVHEVKDAVLGFVARDYVEEIPFTDPLDDFPARYDVLRKEIGGRYIQAKRRHYGPTFGGDSRMRKEVGAALDAATKRKPEARVSQEGHPAQLHAFGWML